MLSIYQWCDYTTTHWNQIILFYSIVISIYLYATHSFAIAFLNYPQVFVFLYLIDVPFALIISSIFSISLVIARICWSDCCVLNLIFISSPFSAVEWIVPSTNYSLTELFNSDFCPAPVWTHSTMTYACSSTLLTHYWFGQSYFHS